MAQPLEAEGWKEFKGIFLVGFYYIINESRNADDACSIYNMLYLVDLSKEIVWY